MVVGAPPLSTPCLTSKKSLSTLVAAWNATIPARVRAYSSGLNFPPRAASRVPMVTEEKVIVKDQGRVERNAVFASKALSHAHQVF